MKGIQNQIVDFLKKTEASGSEIAQKLNINRLTVTKYLNVIHALGMIDFKTVGRAKIWFLKETVSSDNSKSKVKDSVEQYKDILDAQKLILDYLKNNPYGQTWELLSKDLNLSKDLTFQTLRFLKNNDMITYRDKGKRLWFLNYFPTNKTLTDVDIEDMKYKIFSALMQKQMSLSSLSDMIKADINIIARVIGILKDQNLVSYSERAGAKVWYLNKDLNYDKIEVDKKDGLLCLGDNSCVVMNQSFVVGLFLTFNKDMIKRVGYSQGLYNTRRRKYALKTFDKDELFHEQISAFLETGYGVLKSLRMKPFKLVLNESFLAKTVKEVLPQFVNEPSCSLIAGYMEGVYEAIYGNKVQIVENKCVSKGDTNCEFIID